ncbi:MAG: hypothetical protein ACREU3_13810 [Steroidobacteraceae bacterium]
MRTLIRAFGVLALLLPLAALAQAPPGVARGTIESVHGDTLTLRTDAGRTETIELAKNWTVTVLKPVSIDAIQPGSFIGTAEMPQGHGTGRSIEVHVFPPGVKMGAGHYRWNLRKGSMMTNGTVGKVTATHRGRVLEVSYPHGHRRIIVPKNVPIVEFTNGTRALIKPGLPAFLIVAKGPSGTLTSSGIAIGEHGAKPPM